MRIVGERALPAFVGERQRERQGGVVEREGRGARDRARHVGDAIVDDVVLDVGRRRMRGRPAGLEAAALVDRDVDQHRARAHALDQVAPDQLGRGGARHQHGADHQVGRHDLLLDVLGGREQRVHLRAELHVELVEPLQRAVDHGDVGLHAHGDPRRVGARDAAAEHHDLGRGDTRHAAEQDADAALLLFEIVRADLDRHATGDLAHRRQQRQAAAHVGHGLVGDPDPAGFHQALGLRLVGGEVQIGEQHLAWAQQRDLAGLRLLDLDDQLGGAEHRGGGGRDVGADLAIGVVAEADAGAGAALDQDLVAVRDQLARRAGNQADAILVGLDLLGDADQHGLRPSSIRRNNGSRAGCSRRST